MASAPESGLSMQTKPRFSFFDFCDSSHSTNVSAAFRQPSPVPQNPERSEMKETEDLLAAALSKLSVQERSKALDDLHCVGEEVQETPEMVHQSLAEFDAILETSANRIYEVAVNQNRSFVEDSEFRLKFLRANMHNARKSVHQMLNFLQQKAVYFGEHKVAHEISPSDLNGDDIELMRAGFFQIQEGRDRSGRMIVHHSLSRTPSRCTIETMIRVVYHIFVNMLSSIPEVHRLGIVLIYYDESKGGDDLQLPGLNFFSKARKFGDALPIQISSLHFCLHSSPGSLALHNRMLQFLLKAVPQSARTRARLHYGSDLERQYQLRGYGIPLDTFPVDSNGNIRTEILTGWCQEYLEGVTTTTEQQAGHEGPGMTPIPGGIWETDILLGRGRLVQNHPGNMRFREFLDQHIAEYENLARNQRRQACIYYTRELVSNGARFLKHGVADEWIVCGFDEAVDKVSQFYRTRRRRTREEGNL